MRKSFKSRSESSTSSSIAAERLADYRGDCSNSAAATSSGNTAAFGSVSPNLSPSTPDGENTSTANQGSRSNSTCSTLIRTNMSLIDSSESLLCNQLEQSTISSSKEASKEKKLSSGSLGREEKSGDFSARPKQVTVTHPGTNKAKRTSKKKGSIQADLDVAKEFLRCKEEGATRLDLSKSNISVLPSSVKDLTHLTEFYLYGNKLTALPPEIGCLVNLRTLALSENSLTSLPDTLVNLKSLKVLDLRHNKLNEIPEVVYKLTSLVTLYLRFNRVRYVGEEIANLTNLTMLSLRENKIQFLPAGIGKLTHLVTFEASNNHLKHLPPEIGCCTQLSTLDVHHNELADIPETLGQLVNLTRLGLRYNQLSEIPKSLSQCVNMMEFNVENNNIAELPVSESTVSDWKKKRNEIESFCGKLEMKGALESRSILKKSKLEKLDDTLLLWLTKNEVMEN
ncbi:Leucine-rich repeat protein soc-2 [Araneus ventricosus]|uniref:Leucine-rich repeat protein soc-2 n=1 Tax=Araneus ventricosus TaxID=182803 RepID=A0A4Y2BLY5_ARAVE|nr:Leucine-rich repeat protein soc-2 [Araneus ventricosus]